MEFKGKLVVLTGGAIGIGRSAAFEFAKQGARLALLDIAEDELSRTVHVLSTAGYQASGYVCDVGNTENVGRVAAKITQERGVPDIIFNNAYLGRRASIIDLDHERLQLQFNVNVTGPLQLIQAFLPGMISRGSGWIANVSSSNVIIPHAMIAKNMAGYCISKAAMISMTQCLALTLKEHGIGVSLLVPDVTHTGTITEFCDPAGDEFQSASFNFMEKYARRPEPVARELIAGLSQGTFLVSALPSFEERLVAYAQGHMDTALL